VLGRAGVTRSVVGRSRQPRWFSTRWALLACFGLACGRVDDGRREARGDVPWLESCAEDGDCAAGQCLCGVCSVPCNDAECGADGPPGARCLEPEHWLGAALCAGRDAAPMCITACDATGSCGAGFECLDGYCVSGSAAAIARETELVPLGPLCERDRAVWRSVHLERAEQVEALRGCERIEGHLQIDAEQVSDLSALESLRVVRGSIDILARPPLVEGDVPRVELAGLERLESAGRLRFVNVAVDSFAPLSALRALDGRDDSGLYLESVRGLSGLDGLGRLEHTLFIVLSDVPELVSLRGLASLREVGDLDVGGAPLEELGLPAQLAITQHLSLEGTRLRTLEGLGETSQLTRVGLANNEDLVSLEGLRLAERIDSLVLSGNPQLEDVRALAGLRDVSGSLMLLDSPLRGLAGLEALEHVYEIVINGTDIVDLSGLGRLAVIESGFILRNNRALASLAGLPAGTSLRSLDLSGNPGLTRLDIGTASVDALFISECPLVDLSGLGAVTLGSSLGLEGLPNLVSLDGLGPAPGLTSVILRGCPALVNIAALAGLSALDVLRVAECGLANLDALSGLQRLGALDISANPNITQIDALASVAGLQRLSVSQNPSLVALPSFDTVVDLFNLDSCGEQCGFWLGLRDNAVLQRGPSFPQLTQFYSLSAVANPNLQSLGSFAAARSVSELIVEGNPALAALGLPSVEAAGRLIIRGNALPESELAALRAVPGVNDRRIVSNGAGPDRLDPCPWVGDGVCDEVFESCGPGTDRPDCQGYDVPAWGTAGSLQ
jgi:Leucine-rich repeat (LRR) protein